MDRQRRRTMNKKCDRRHDGAEKHVEATGVAALLVAPVVHKPK